MTNSIKGWEIYNVTYNDIDITRSVVDDINNIPVLEQNSSMKIVFVSDSVGNPVVDVIHSGISIFIMNKNIIIKHLGASNLVTLYTKEGITLQTVQSDIGEVTINASQYVDGLYFVKIRDDEKYLTFKTILH